MISIDTQISIAASAAKVWAILTDFPRMPEWNPFIRMISGVPTVGGRLTVEVAPQGQSAMTFKPQVLVADEGRELRWRGTFLGGWLFSGEHSFVLDEIRPGTTRLIHGEKFSGLLAPAIMRGQALAATKQGFADMNLALKRRAE